MLSVFGIALAFWVVGQVLSLFCFLLLYDHDPGFCCSIDMFLFFSFVVDSIDFVNCLLCVKINFCWELYAKCSESLMEKS